MPDKEIEKTPEKGEDEEIIEVYEPEVIDQEFRRPRFSRVDCRCCGCSGTVMFLILLAVVTLLIYYIFSRT